MFIMRSNPRCAMPLANSKEIQLLKEGNYPEESTTVLDLLCGCYGWQGGTIHQAIKKLDNLNDQQYFDIKTEMFCANIDKRSAGYDKLVKYLEKCA